jgi:hypothetical protein
VLNPVARALAVPVRGFTLWQTIGGLLWTVAGREAVRVGELWRFAI